MSSVEISSITQPLVKTEDGSKYLTPNEYIAYVARVSNPDNQLNTLTAPKLIKHLYSHRHWSPFQLGFLVMKVQTTRDISHQIIRHWSFSDAGGDANFQEFSQRYAEVTNFELRECRLQDTKNRQNSIETSDEELIALWKKVQEQVLDVTEMAYKWALEAGIAKEQARVVLPEGLTQTTFFMGGTLRSWIHYTMNRAKKEGAQKEHSEIAQKCQAILLEHYPDLKLLFEE